MAQANSELNLVSFNFHISLFRGLDLALALALALANLSELVKSV